MFDCNGRHARWKGEEKLSALGFQLFVRKVLLIAESRKLKAVL
jgi:hypothetical protein